MAQRPQAALADRWDALRRLLVDNSHTFERVEGRGAGCAGAAATFRELGRIADGLGLTPLVNLAREALAVIDLEQWGAATALDQSVVRRAAYAAQTLARLAEVRVVSGGARRGARSRRRRRGRRR